MLKEQKRDAWKQGIIDSELDRLIFSLRGSASDSSGMEVEDNIQSDDHLYRILRFGMKLN
jgi:hypothetical protein